MWYSDYKDSFSLLNMKTLVLHWKINKSKAKRSFKSLDLVGALLKPSFLHQVELKSGSSYDATIRDVDEKADIALIQIDTPVSTRSFMIGD